MPVCKGLGPDFTPFVDHHDGEAVCYFAMFTNANNSDVIAWALITQSERLSGLPE
jgi:hypothetical protein